MRRVLVVEDDKNNMRLIVKLLKGHGYEAVIEAETGEEEEKNAELERMNDVFVGREFRIKELRDRVKELELKIDD